MSWDAQLECGCCGSTLYEVNYTHNVNTMINAALAATGTSVDQSWWKTLDGMRREDSIPFLGNIISELHNTAYDNLNPENGWGSRAEVVTVLHEMLWAAVSKTSAPTWRCEG